jgi:uncharacterized protein
MRNLFAAPARAVFSLCFAFLSYGAVAQTTIPELWGQRVHDEAKVLSAATVDQLESKLKVYEDSTTNQIAILIISTLGDQPIEDYSIKVAEKWKLGTKKNDNGVLILVVADDHKMRIDAGEGLEDRLTDARCSQIIRDEMAPDFRRGDYDAGLKDAVNAIIKTIGGEYEAKTAAASSGEAWYVTLIEGIIVFVLLFSFTYTALFSTGCAGWGVYAFLIPFYALFTWIFIGVIAAKILFGIYLIGFPIAKISFARTRWGKAKIADWSKKTYSGSSRSGGSFLGGVGGFFLGGGGGGFSGGGGSFGGGGASGSW